VGYGYGWSDSGSILHNLYISGLTALGFNYTFTQRIILGLLIFFSALFSYLFTREILGGHPHSKILGVIVGLLYTLNPYAFTWIWWRFLSVIYIYPVWPLIFLVIVKILKGNAGNKQLILFALLLSLFAPGISATVLLLSLGLAVIAFLVAYIVVARPKVSPIGKKLAFFGLIFGGLNAYWFIPGLFLVNHQVANALTAESPTVAFSYVSQFSAIYNVVRLWGETALHIDFFGQSYYGIGISRVLGSAAMGLMLLVPIIAIAILLANVERIKKAIRNVVLALVAIMVIGLFMAKGGNAPFASINTDILRVPLGVAFRIPFDKFGYWLALTYAVLTPMVFMVLKGRTSKAVAGVLLGIYILVPAAIFFLPNMLVSEDKNTLKGVIAKVPEQYTEITRIGLTKQDRVLVLPTTSGGEASFNWPKGSQTNSHDVVSDYTSADVIALPNGNSYSDNLTSAVPNELFSGLYDESTIDRTLKTLGITYIFVHKDWNKGFMLNKTPWPEYYLPMVRMLPDVSTVTVNPYFEVYRLSKVSTKNKDVVIPAETVDGSGRSFNIQNLANALSLFGSDTGLLSGNYSSKLVTSPEPVLDGDQVSFQFQATSPTAVAIKKSVLNRLSPAANITLDGKAAPMVATNMNGSEYQTLSDPINHGSHTLAISNITPVPIVDPSFNSVARDTQLDWECGTKFSEQIKQVKSLVPTNTYLSLQSKNENASCHMLTVGTISSASNALITFKYKTEAGGGARVVVYENDAKGEGGSGDQIFNEQLPAAKDWTNFSFHFPTKQGKLYRPILYSGYTDGERSTTDYKDMNGAMVPEGFSELVTTTGIKAQQPPSGNATLSKVYDSSALKVVDVSSTRRETVLALNQAFDPYWHAYYVPSNYRPTILDSLFGPIKGRAVKESLHQKYNEYGNVWLLAKQASSQQEKMRVVVEYLPQRLFVAGIVITGVFFAISMLLIVFNPKRLHYGGKIPTR
jgi:hypothetical protein